MCSLRGIKRYYGETKPVLSSTSVESLLKMVGKDVNVIFSVAFALVLFMGSFSEPETCWKLVLHFLQERLMTLKKQAAQITQQAQREKESFLKERSNLEAMLQRVRRCPHLHVCACGQPCFCVHSWHKRIIKMFSIVFHLFLLYLLRRKKTSPCWKENMLNSLVDGVSR